MLIDNNIPQGIRGADNSNNIRTENGQIDQNDTPFLTSGVNASNPGRPNEVSQQDSFNGGRHDSGADSSTDTDGTGRNTTGSTGIKRFISNSSKNAEETHSPNVSISGSVIASISAMTLGICLNSGLSVTHSSIATVVAGSGALIGGLPGYCAALIANLRSATEVYSTPETSQEGVRSVLEMLGFMQGEAKDLQEALKVDKISSLATVSNSRFRHRLIEIRITNDRMNELELGFQVFREHYFKRNREKCNADGSTCIDNSFRLSEYSTEVHWELMKISGSLDDSDFSITKDIHDISSIRQQDSNDSNIRQVSSGDSIEVRPRDTRPSAQHSVERSRVVAKSHSNNHSMEPSETPNINTTDEDDSLPPTKRIERLFETQGIAHPTAPPMPTQVPLTPVVSRVQAQAAAGGAGGGGGDEDSSDDDTPQNNNNKPRKVHFNAPDQPPTPPDSTGNPNGGSGGGDGGGDDGGNGNDDTFDNESEDSSSESESDDDFPYLSSKGLKNIDASKNPLPHFPVSQNDAKSYLLKLTTEMDGINAGSLFDTTDNRLAKPTWRGRRRKGKKFRRYRKKTKIWDELDRGLLYYIRGTAIANNHPLKSELGRIKCGVTAFDMIHKALDPVRYDKMNSSAKALKAFNDLRLQSTSKGSFENSKSLSTTELKISRQTI